MPISLTVARRLLSLLKGWPILPDMSEADLVFATATLIGICGFLRGGEFLASKGSDRPVLSISSMLVHRTQPRRLCISIHRPKARWWLTEESATVYAHPDDDEFCPLRLWNGYNSQRERILKRPLTSDDPAFTMPGSSKPLSKVLMMKRTSELLQLAQISYVDGIGRVLPVRASSWRTGGVRSAIDSKVSDPIICAMGRWSSTAWQAYLLKTPLDLNLASTSMWTYAALHTPAMVERVVVSEASERFFASCNASDSNVVTEYDLNGSSRVRQSSRKRKVASGGDGTV